MLDKRCWSLKHNIPMDTLSALQFHGFSFSIPRTIPRTTRSSVFMPRLCSPLVSHLKFSSMHSFRATKTKRRRHMQISAASRDYYKTLKIPRTANKNEIKSAYRKLAREYHPDVSKSPGTEEKFKEIAAAYEVLSDDEKRSLYDQYGEAAFKDMNGEDSSYATGVDPFDLFQSFFSGRSGMFSGFDDMGESQFDVRHSASQQGNDIRLNFSLSFKEAVTGVVKNIDIPRLETCRKCKGSGAKSPSNIKNCSYCGGKGELRESQRTAYGVFSQISMCLRCKGEGKVITDHCQECGGNGRVFCQKTVRVDIPPGVNSGDVVEIPREGNAGQKGGKPGNLYIVLDLKGMPGIERDGINLYSKVTINYTEAILGTTIKVETLEGYKMLEIPAGTQPDDVMIMRNLGIPKLRNPSTRGDHLFTVNISIPTALSENEQMLVMELAKLHSSSKVSSKVSPAQDQSSVREQWKASSAEDISRKNSSKESFWEPMKEMWKKRSKESSTERFSCLTIQVMPSAKMQQLSFSFTSAICQFSQLKLALLTFCILVAFFFRNIKGKTKHR